MGKMERFLRIFTVFLLLLTIYFAFTGIQALDRLHLSNMRLISALEKQRNSPVARPPQIAVSGSVEAVPAANAKYFDPQAKIGGKLSSALSADAPGFNPLTVNEATASTIFSLCSATLAERDWQNPEQFKPMLAESWEISPDHLNYRIKLRRNARWQSYRCPDTGRMIPAREITADDFVFMVEAMRDPDVDCASRRSYYKDLESITAVGRYELLVRWKKAYYGSLDSTLSLFPLPREYYCPDGKFDGKKFNMDHRRNRTIISCGPYLFDSWEKDRKIRLKRNPDYFGIPLGIAPPLETREFEIIKHPNTQLQALLGGKIDMMSLSAEQWVRRAGEKRFKDGTLSRYRFSGRGYSYIGYNARLECFRDSKTRRALTLLIDRERILKEVMHGCGSIANGPFAPGYCFKFAHICSHFLSA